MDSTSSRFHARFGPVHFAIKGQGDLFDAIIADFPADPSADGIEPLVTFHLLAPQATLPRRTPSTLTETGSVGERGMTLRVKGFEVRMELPGNGALERMEVYCLPSPSPKRKVAARLPKILQESLTSRFVTMTSLQALDFIFHVFLWIMQLLLLRQSASLIHASSMHSPKRGESLLIAGWGGVGKTSLSSYAYLKRPDAWQFLSDDLSLLDAQGNLWHNPLGIHLYPYNVEGFDELWHRLSQTMSHLDRLHWNVRRSIKRPVVRRVAPRDLWSSTGLSRLTTVILLERWTESRPTIQDIDLDVFTNKAQHVLLHELRDLMTPIILANASLQPGWSALVPPISEYMDEVAKVYKNGLGSKRLIHVRVPRQWNPTTLGEFLFEQLDG